MKKIWKRGIAAAVVAVLVFSLAACGASTGAKKAASDSSKSKSASSGSTVTLKFGATGWKQYGQLLQAAGLDNFDGYNVEYSVFQGGNLCLEAMAANEIDLTVTSEIPPVAASLTSNGGNFKIALISGSSPQDQELVALKKSGISKVSQLKGKKVGYVANTTAEYFLNVMLERAGLSWKDIKPVKITTADGVTALVNGDIDAFASYGNSINAAKNSGAVTLDSAIDILSGNFPVEISDSALADSAKVDAIADYLARVDKAFDWALSHQEEWAKIQAEPTGMTTQDTETLFKDSVSDKGYINKFLEVTDSSIKSEQSVADTFYKLGDLEQKVDVSKLYDKDFYAKYKAARSKYE